MKRPILSSFALLLILGAGPACRPETTEPADEGPRAGQTPETSDALAGLDELRMVWLQDQGDATDTLARGQSLLVMSWDLRSRTEQPLVAAAGSYAKPLVVAGGRQVVFSDRRLQRVFLSSGPEGEPAALGPGVALAIWRDPADGQNWVYAGLDPTDKDPGEYRRLERFPLADPGRRERVALDGIVNEDNLQLAPDGQLAGGVFPWPRVGWLDLRSGATEQVGEGCWGGLAPLTTPLLCFLDGAHRQMTLMPRGAADRRWHFSFDAVPALRGHEVYHPRWTSHPRLFVVTGPYKTRPLSNAIRAGGTGVEVFLVRLNASLTQVEAWAQITRNAKADFYPDAWVGPVSSLEVAREPGPTGVTDTRPAAAERIVVEVKLAAVAATPTLRAIAPYTQALVAGQYDVARVIEGRLPHTTIAVAHWVLRNGRSVPGSTRVPGETLRLSIEPYSSHPELEGERLIMDPGATTLPLFYDVSTD